jgi:glycosyltransferase involved in cell wall biosynthesis
MKGMRFAILIPTYQPQEDLRGVIQGIIGSSLPKDEYQVILIDDGSTEKTHIFQEEVGKYPSNITLIVHPENRGKGAALKTGIREALRDGTFTHVVTVDADGQHQIPDIIKVIDGARANPKYLVLGARAFSGEVPARSKFGNNMTKAIFAFFTDQGVTDTQTGLRAFDIDFAERTLDIKKDRYDFELGMLMRAVSDRTPIIEVPITTVYIEENKSSHFRPIVDSIRIYQLFFKYALSSFVSIAFDYVLFLFFHHILGGVLEPNIAARVISLPVNFFLNKELVFRYKGSKVAFIKYLLLAIANPIIVSGLIMFLETLGVPVAVGKILAESCMFFFNFQVQKYIFRPV